MDTYARETLAVWPRDVLPVLFGARKGLFSWTPLALIAVAGLVAGLRRNPTCAAGLIVLALTAWLYGGWHM